MLCSAAGSWGFGSLPDVPKGPLCLVRSTTYIQSTPLFKLKRSWPSAIAGWMWGESQSAFRSRARHGGIVGWCWPLKPAQAQPSLRIPSVGAVERARRELARPAAQLGIRSGSRHLGSRLGSSALAPQCAGSLLNRIHACRINPSGRNCQAWNCRLTIPSGWSVKIH